MDIRGRLGGSYVLLLVVLPAWQVLIRPDDHGQEAGSSSSNGKKKKAGSSSSSKQREVIELLDSTSDEDDDDHQAASSKPRRPPPSPSASSSSSAARWVHVDPVRRLVDEAAAVEGLRRPRGYSGPRRLHFVVGVDRQARVTDLTR